MHLGRRSEEAMVSSSNGPKSFVPGFVSLSIVPWVVSGHPLLAATGTDQGREGDS